MDSEDAAVLVTMVSSFTIGSVVFIRVDRTIDRIRLDRSRRISISVDPYTPVGGAILALVLGFYVMSVRQYELKYIPR